MDAGGGGEEVVVDNVEGAGGGLDLYELPEDCISNVLSFTGPSDTCRLSTISSMFKSAAESDAVWERFLPDDYRSIISQSSSADSSLSSLSCLSSKKQLYLSLCEHPILIEGGKKSFQLDKWTGKKCCMISARDLMIVWADTPRYWRWTPDSRFGEVAELLNVCWFEIRGKINTCMLSPMTLYTAYLVFKATAGIYGFEHQPVEATVGLAGTEGCTRTVQLEPEGRRIRRRVGSFGRSRFAGLQASVPPTESDHVCPKKRGDGWMEIELGEFFNKEGDAGELEMSVLEVKGGDWKGGIMVQGIEIRPKAGK